MEDFAMFDEVACEEFYNEDWALWMDEMEMEAVNAELQVIADEAREDEIFEDWSQMVMDRCWSSSLEASHVAP